MTVCWAGVGVQRAPRKEALGVLQAGDVSGGPCCDWLACSLVVVPVYAPLAACEDVFFFLVNQFCMLYLV